MKKSRGSYVMPSLDDFPLPTDRDFVALRDYLQAPENPDSPKEVTRSTGKNLEAWAKSPALSQKLETTRAEVLAIDNWISAILIFDPECLQDEEHILSARQVLWLMQLLVQHYQGNDTAERNARRFGLKSKRDFYRKVGLAQAVLAAGLAAAQRTVPVRQAYELTPLTELFAEQMRRCPHASDDEQPDLDKDIEDGEVDDDDAQFWLDQYDRRKLTVI